MKHLQRAVAILVLGLGAWAVGAPWAEAGFAARELFVLGVGRTSGVAGSQWYSTLWVTNPSSTLVVDVQIRFLKRNQPNPTPASHTVVLQPGETVRFDNVVESLFGETGTSGALQILASGDVLAVSRTFDQPSGTPVGASKGYFVAGIPASFALGLGESTRLQGVSQGGGEDFRFNFGLLETTGADVTVLARLRNAQGQVLASKEFAVRGREFRQWAASDLGSTAATANGVLELEVVGGSGKIVAFGSLIANASNDAAGIEMTLRSSSLAENSAPTTAATASSAATTVTWVVDRLYQILLEIQRHGSWDPATGWWTVTLALPYGRSAELQVRFEDAQGSPQQYFNPTIVTTIRVKGRATGPQGWVTFDLVITGFGPLSQTLTVNGSGTASYQGVTGTFTVTNLVMPKRPGAYPSSGTIVVSIPPATTATVTFDGSQYAQGAYAMGPATRTFIINMENGDVTWSS